MNSEYRIVDAESVNRKEWQDYIDRHEFGGVFHTPFFYDSLSCASHFIPFAYFALSATGEIKALFSGYTQTVKGGVMKHLSTRAVTLASPIYDSRDALSELVNAVKKILPGKPIYTEVRNSHSQLGYQDEMRSAGFLWVRHYNIVKELPENIETLWKQIGRKRKDGINKASKFGFVFREDHNKESIDLFYDLLLESYMRIKLPIPRKDLFTCFYNASGRLFCRLFLLLENEEVKISLFTFTYKETMYAYYIGNTSDRSFLNKRPVDLFYYEVMKWCIQNGIKFFDWMGAGKPDVDYGVRDFKLQYGGDLVDLGRFIYVNSPFRYKLAKIGLNVFQKIGRVN